MASGSGRKSRDVWSLACAVVLPDTWHTLVVDCTAYYLAGSERTAMFLPRADALMLLVWERATGTLWNAERASGPVLERPVVPPERAF